MVHDVGMFLYQVVVSNPIVERLVVASAELAILVTALVVLIRLGTVRSPRIQSFLWLVVLSKALVSLIWGGMLPVVSLEYDLNVEKYASFAQSPPEDLNATHKSVDAEFGGHLAAGDSSNGLRTILMTELFDRYAAAEIVGYALTGIWSFGFIISIGIVLGGAIRLSKLRRDASPLSGELSRVCDEIRCAIGLRTRPHIAVSAEVSSPLVSGVTRPLVLLPACIVCDNERRKLLHWVIRHEFTHVRHWDHISNAIRVMATTVFYFHPAVRYASRQWELATELACDARLVSTDGEAREYAHSLYELLNRMSYLKFDRTLGGLYASRTQVGKRIEALLKHSLWKRPRASVLGTAFLVPIAILALLASINMHGTAERSEQAIGGPHEIWINRASIEETDGTTTWALRARGRIAFAADYLRVDSMSSRAHLVISQSGPAGRKILEVIPGKDGRPIHKFRSDGKYQPFDAETAEWFESMVKWLLIDRRRVDPPASVGDARLYSTAVNKSSVGL